MADRQKEVEVYDTSSNLGGSFTVSIVEEIDETQSSRCAFGTDAPPSTGGKSGGNGMVPCSPRREASSRRSASCRFFQIARRSEKWRGGAGTGPFSRAHI